MGFPIPPQGHKVREMFDVADIAVMLAPDNRYKLPDFRKALVAARKTFECEGRRAKGKTRVCVMCWRANDEFWLISVGPRGGWRKEWNFGKGY